MWNKRKEKVVQSSGKRKAKAETAKRFVRPQASKRLYPPPPPSPSAKKNFLDLEKPFFAKVFLEEGIIGLDWIGLV